MSHLDGPKANELDYDAEKEEQSVSAKVDHDFHYSHPLYRKLLRLGVEERGTLFAHLLVADTPTVTTFKVSGLSPRSYAQAPITIRYSLYGYPRTVMCYRTLQQLVL